MTSGNGATLTYDAAGRLYQISKSGFTTTRRLYAGSALIAVYDTGGNILQRYVHGPGIDEPLIWYEGSSTIPANTNYLGADERGSIVAVTDAYGVVSDVNSYDAYGNKASGNVGLFQYTGQQWIEEVGLYYYKARWYNPDLGRFMQTDPIGYGDGMNMYGYVGGDPVNMSDPSGRFGVPGAGAGAAIGGAFGGGLAVVAEVIRQQRAYGGVRDLRQVAVAGIGGAFAGAVTGALIGSGVGIASVAIASSRYSAVTSFAVSAINQSLANEKFGTPISNSEIFTAGATGFVAGGIPVPGTGVVGSIIFSSILQQAFAAGQRRPFSRQSKTIDGRTATVTVEDVVTFDPELYNRGYYDQIMHQWLSQLTITFMVNAAEPPRETRVEVVDCNNCNSAGGSPVNRGRKINDH